ncbi:hypothetical protein MmiEs2_09320 [Methanimicrococcus stummii]|uniref:Uncharacterized protein n=1 Tax=Methanimicrococcus stummii TaxID=3028294 RepID=A0AA96ZXA6_9EURY|nr:hypothetical protein MmiEs2_09320 [Methanimicrococcus sp. Es2]
MLRIYFLNDLFFSDSILFSFLFLSYQFHFLLFIFIFEHFHIGH